MKIIYYLFFSGLLCFYTLNLFGQGANCKSAQPMCSDLPITFPASTETTSTDLNTRNLRGCLGSAPNPAWYFLKIGGSGPINIYISQERISGGGADVDFACWGPFSSNDWNSICTAQLGNTGSVSSHRPLNPPGDHKNGTEMGGYPRPSPSKMIDCSYTGQATEWCYIPNAQTGEYYLLCLTNYSNAPANITFKRLPIDGSGTTDCSIVPADALGDTICYGSDIKIKIPRSKTKEQYNVIIPGGGTYPPGKVWGNGGVVTITIPARLAATLRKGTHTFHVVAWEGNTQSRPTEVPVMVEELDTRSLSYWGDRDPLPIAADKGVPICPGNNLILGFALPGSNTPIDLDGEVPPRFYEKIGNTNNYLFLGTGNQGQYQFKRRVNANEFYAVDRETQYGKCKMSKQSVRVLKGSTPKFKMTIQDGVNKDGIRDLEPSGLQPTDRKGQGGNVDNDDPTLPEAAAVNIDGYWSPLSENPWVKERHISPIPNRGTLENDKVLYTIFDFRDGSSGAPITPSKTYFFGVPTPPGGVNVNRRDTLIDDQETTMTGVVVDRDGCEGRLDTTILRLKPPKIRLTLTNADTTVCGNDLVEIKARIVSVEDPSYFPLTFKWQTINPETFSPIDGLPKTDPKNPSVIIGDGGNGTGNGTESKLVTLADQHSTVTFKVRVGTLIKVHAETRDLETGIFGPDGDEIKNKFKSSSYFARVNRLPLPSPTHKQTMTFEQTGVNNDGSLIVQGYTYFCAGSSVRIKSDGVRNYLWTVTTPDSPTPVVVGRERVTTISEAVNRTPGWRTVQLDMVGYNGCANDTSLRYQILPLPQVEIIRGNVAGGDITQDDCLNQIKKLTLKVISSPNDTIAAPGGKDDPQYNVANGYDPGTRYEPATDKDYTWKPGYNTDPNPPIGPAITVFPDTTQIYAATYTDTRGCMASWVDTVHAPVRVRAFAKKSQYCLGEDIELGVEMIGTATKVELQDKRYEWESPSSSTAFPIQVDPNGKVLGIDIENYISSPSPADYNNGGWDLKFKAFGRRDACQGYDTVTVKIRPKPNFEIDVKGDDMANVFFSPPYLPPSSPSYSTSANPWEIVDVTKFAIVRLDFDDDIKDITDQYAVKTTTKWTSNSSEWTPPDAAPSPYKATREDYPAGINSSADTVQKITPKEDIQYTIQVTNEWYNLFTGDSLQCVSEEEHVKIEEPAGIKIDVQDPPKTIDTTRFGQRVMTVCQDEIESGIKIEIKGKASLSAVKDILWYKVKLDGQGKYTPTHGPYLSTFDPPTPPSPAGTLDNCPGGEWNSPLFPLTVKLPSTAATVCEDRKPLQGDFGNQNPILSNSNENFDLQWLDTISTFALYVHAGDTYGKSGYDILYITVLPKPERPEFTIDAPIGAYRDKGGIYSFDLQNPPPPPPYPDAENNIGKLDSTYNVWCYNKPYSITFIDRTVDYTWSTRKGVRQDLYDEFTYWLSPKEVTLYTIKAKNKAECSSPDRKILVHPITDINIAVALPESICKNDSIVIKLDPGTDPTWRLNNKELRSYNEDTLVVSYQKKQYGAAGSLEEIKTPSKIAIERSTVPGYSYEEGTSTSPPSFTTLPSLPSPPSYISPIVFAGCSDSLVLNIETWLNTPEIGAVLPQDTLLIKYNSHTKSYSLCLGSNPRFDVLTYREARRQGLASSGDDRLREAIEGNTPSNTFFEWEYDKSKSTIDWDPMSSFGHIRPLQPYGIEPFTLTVYNWNKVCKDTVELRIRADEVPKINFSYAPKRINRKNKEVFFKYDADPSYSYEWDLDIDSDKDEGKIPSPSSGELYYFNDDTKNKWVGRVIAAKDSGCRVEIPIKIARGLYIPNTFTPNGDSKNDMFLDPEEDLNALGLSISDFRFSVFTRRGQKVYDGSEGWDGTYNGNPQPSDVYYYVVEYTFDGEQVVHKGSVTLLR